MYEKYSFIPEEETAVKGFKEALELSNDREYSMLKVPYEKISVTETGQIILDKVEHKTTRWGFEKFCGLLGIPRPFARKIPEDLLNDNISRLLKEKNKQEEVLFFNSKKALLGVAKKNNEPFNNTDFLTQVSTIHEKKMDIHEIIISDRGATVNLFTDIVNLEPKVGDITKVGFNVHNSDTGGLPTATLLFLYRLACQNGAVMREAWGSAKRTYNRKISKETALASFMSQTEKISTNVELLTKCFLKMIELHITDEYFKRNWSSVRTVLGSEASADEGLDITAEDRKEMFAKILKRQSQNRRSLMEKLQVEKPEVLSKTYYDLYNQVTALEKNQRLDEKVAVRRIGGDILYKMLRIETSAN